MKALVTGGTGFIGTHLVDLLLARGFEVYVLVRNANKEPSLLKKKIHLLRGDLFSIPGLPAGLDIVFHLAGKTRTLSSNDYYTVNQEGTASLFRSLAASRERPKAILLSSQAAAGPSFAGRPLRETDPPHPVTPYGWSKLRGEQEALKFKDDFPVVIVRSCSVFGPLDRDFLGYFRLAAKGIVLTMAGNKAGNIIYVKDLAEALFLCARTEIPSGEIFHIGDSHMYTWEQLGIAVAATTGKRCRKIKIPNGLVYLIALLNEARYHLTRKPGILDRDKYCDLVQPGWLLDVRKAAEMLSFQTHYPLEQAVRETVSWYLAKGWL